MGYNYYIKAKRELLKLQGHTKKVLTPYVKHTHT